MSETGKQRVCSGCQEAGHNVRTCPKVKAKKAKPALAAKSADAPIAAAPVSSSSMVLATEPVEGVPVVTSLGQAGALHVPAEFEELVKQVHENGTTIRLSFRESEGAVNDFVLQFRREREGEKVMRFDTNEATKIYELLGWALQKQAARLSTKLLPAKTPVANGAKQATAG